MKRLVKITALIMVAILAFSLSSCDLIEDATITPALNGIDCNKIQLGIISSEDSDKEGTNSYVQQQAINDMQNTYNLAGTILKEEIDTSNTEKIENAIISCVKESGCNVVIATDPAFADIIYKYSCNKDYKDVIFSCCDNTFKYDSTANYNCYYPDEYPAYCLAGVVAASKLGETNIPVTLKDAKALEAFTLGVKAVAPKANVISGAEIETYATVNVNWNVYFLTLIENITLGKFAEMGNYKDSVSTGVCNVTPSEEFESTAVNTNLAHARAFFTNGTWNLSNASSIQFQN